MSQLNTERLRGFVSDPVTSDAVYELLLQAFMRKRGGSVEEKAAQMIAIELLQEAWQEMERYKKNSNSNSIPRQVGL